MWISLKFEWNFLIYELVYVKKIPDGWSIDNFFCEHLIIRTKSVLVSYELVSNRSQ